MNNGQLGPVGVLNTSVLNERMWLRLSDLRKQIHLALTTKKKVFPRGLSAEDLKMRIDRAFGTKFCTAEVVLIQRTNAIEQCQTRTGLVPICIDLPHGYLVAVEKTICLPKTIYHDPFAHLINRK